jgi:hypothetical protein
VDTVIQRNQTSDPNRRLRRSVDLDVAGGDFMLQGRFSDWESGLAFGPDLDRVSVRLAIDATSVRDSGDGPTLLSFHSRDVQRTGEGSYRAVGTFSGPRGAKAGEVQIESPLGHTALIVVTFSATKADFGVGWPDLVENVVPFVRDTDGTPTRSAHAWFQTPSLGRA